MALRWAAGGIFLSFFVLASAVRAQTPIDCDDLLEENAQQKAEIKWLNDVITKNISDLNTLIQNVNNRVDNNIGSIEDNSDLIDIVSGRVISNEAHIAQNKRRIDENQANMDVLDGKVDALDVKVKEDEAKLDSLAVKVEELHEAPVGSITAWVSKPSPDGVETALPEGWLKCDGSPIPAPSMWEGKVTPNLNGERRFLRGGSDADMLTVEEDQLQEHMHEVTDPGHNHPYVDKYTENMPPTNNKGPEDGNGNFGHPHNSETSKEYSGISVAGVESIYRSGDETRPKNMNVIYIIKVW